MPLALIQSVLCFASLFGQVTERDASYTLKAKWISGTVLKYTLTTTILVNDSTKPRITTSAIKYDVQSVEDGIGTIVATVGPTKLGEKIMSPQQTVRLQMDSRLDLAGELKGKGPGSIGAVYPEGPVKAKDTWTQKISVPFGSAPISAEHVLTFLGLGELDGKQVAIISGKFSGVGESSDGPMTLSGDTITYINLQDGQVQKTVETAQVRQDSNDPKYRATAKVIVVYRRE